MNRFDVRIATALGKDRPVLLISHDDACAAQETVVAVPIRTKPPPFQCHGLPDILSLRDAHDLRGYIRFDLPHFYRRSDIGRLIRRFTDAEDVERLNAAIKDAFQIP
ncbi:MAG TPA: type II toxin-antitoxin system PemK/MazF family toxin [Candidatus Baltobacteraceae bacterium]|nr:type II toxin-antitoxin system PemK/MazF family toxin [Candidatus Baltobacteraceae bacterium]